MNGKIKRMGEVLFNFYLFVSVKKNKTFIYLFVYFLKGDEPEFLILFKGFLVKIHSPLNYKDRKLKIYHCSQVTTVLSISDPKNCIKHFILSKYILSIFQIFIKMYNQLSKLFILKSHNLAICSIEFVISLA